ncbi:MAG: OB-fold domain-containing protein [Hydrogenophilaceae bacterium]|jgi:uncharacterized OB-fold protein|nr:OB-fold domain-containing protein [Hydrogenophilaceae bacterium]
MQINAIAPDLFDVTPGGPRLIGARRKADGKIVFPAPRGAEAAHYDRIALSDRGTLWSFTVQRFRPKSPPYAGADDERTFKPYALGYIELPGEVIVESRIEIDDFSKLRIGMPMRLALKPFAKAGGEEAETYVFEPELRA